MACPASRGRKGIAAVRQGRARAARQKAVGSGPTSETRTNTGVSAMHAAPTSSSPSARRALLSLTTTAKR